MSKDENTIVVPIVNEEIIHKQIITDQKNILLYLRLDHLRVIYEFLDYQEISLLFSTCKHM